MNLAFISWSARLCCFSTGICCTVSRFTAICIGNFYHALVKKRTSMCHQNSLKVVKEKKMSHVWRRVVELFREGIILSHPVSFSTSTLKFVLRACIFPYFVRINLPFEIIPSLWRLFSLRSPFFFLLLTLFFVTFFFQSSETLQYSRRLTRRKINIAYNFAKKHQNNVLWNLQRYVMVFI